MVQINMLPWREQARELKKKKFFISLGASIGLALLLIFFFHLYYSDLITYQDHRNQYLQGLISQRQVEIDGLRAKKKEQDQTQAKLEFLMGLRQKSYSAVALLNALSQIVPESITLTKLVRDGNSITLEGKAQSELAITAFLKSISQVSIFSQPVLTGINTNTSKEGNGECIFQLKVEQRE